jgi:phosphatidylglycerol:prolipoprotein diacylglycerol transferase
MWPMIGGLRTYTFVYVLSMLAFLATALFYCRRMGISRKVGVALSGCYVFGMAVGARILYDVLNHRFDGHNYLRIGYYFEDGLWGGPLAYLMVAVTGVVLLGRDRARLLDLVALALTIPMILAKVACFVNGCCYGAASDVPWALSFPVGAKAPVDILRHPTQLYEIVMLIVIAFTLDRLDRPRWRGTLLLWFVMLYGVGRPLTEWFRDAPERVPTAGPFTASQVTCAAAAFVAAVALLALRNRRAGGLWVRSVNDVADAAYDAELP